MFTVTVTVGAMSTEARVIKSFPSVASDASTIATAPDVACGHEYRETLERGCNGSIM